MRRRLLIAAVFLLAGAAGVLLSVGIAWCQITVGPVSEHGPKFIAARTDSGSLRQFVLVNTASRFGVEAVAYTSTDSMAWHRLGLQVNEEIPAAPLWAPWPDETDRIGHTNLYVACGWPVKCLVAECMEQDSRWYLSEDQVYEQLIRALSPDQSQRRQRREPSGSRAARQLPPSVPALHTPAHWTHAIVLDQRRHGPFTAAVLPFGIIPLGLMANTLLFGLLVAAFIVAVRGHVGRVVLTVLLFVLLGAVVNVGVAWGCAVWSPMSVTGFAEQRDLHTVFVGSGAGVGIVAEDSMSNNYQLTVAISSGWPLPALKRETWLSFVMPLPAQREGREAAIVLIYPQLAHRQSSPESWQPVFRFYRSYDAAVRQAVLGSTAVRRSVGFLTPAWPGFALNTLSYAAVLWLLIGGPFHLRRRIRFWQGFCPWCKYPMGESDVCSECGWKLARVAPLTCPHESR